MGRFEEQAAAAAAAAAGGGGCCCCGSILNFVQFVTHTSATTHSLLNLCNKKSKPLPPPPASFELIS